MFEAVPDQECECCSTDSKQQQQFSCGRVCVAVNQQQIVYVLLMLCGCVDVVEDDAGVCVR